MFPEDSIQSMVSPWWVSERGDRLARGRLVVAYTQHADAHPFVLTVEGKKEPSDPTRARMRIEPLRSDLPTKPPSPPSPALPLEPGESWCVRRARRRACVVLGVTGPDVHRPMRSAEPSTPVGPAILLAPFYDATAVAPAFVARARHAEYAYCVWDKLPMAGNREVLLRLDQLQPFGRDPLGFEWTDHALSPEALAVLDAWLVWNLTGALPAGDLRDFRELARGG